MAHKFISEINPGESIDDVYMVKEPILRSTTRGDLYIAMFLSDRSGQLNGRMWQATEAVYKLLPKPGFVRVQGRSELYQNNLQIVVNNISVIDSGKVSLEDFLSRTDKDTEQMFEEVKSIMGRIEHPQLKALVGEFLADAELMEKFCHAPGGVKLHHDCIGGLLEHTHNMLRVALAILPLYPKVQADLVLAGVFLHDMGKTEELSYDMAFSYTDSGQLIGHIVQTVLMANQKADALAAKGTQIDGMILDALGHIILSHHGEYEFGSPKLPATPEAFMVYYIDDLDAKMSQVTMAIDKELSDSNWTAWQNALQTRLYRKRIEEI
ncbi:MAG: 3'-5' exoribonuclease YhaM family protein [Planctomycetota bacterium]|jgi:3'-5' exoribonuclease